MIKALPFLMLFTLDAVADGFSSYDDHQKLNGYYIVDAGNVSATTDGIRINSRCFRVGPYEIIDKSEQPALVLTKGDKNAHVAIFKRETLGTSVTIHPLTLVQCDVTNQTNDTTAPAFPSCAGLNKATCEYIIDKWGIQHLSWAKRMDNMFKNNKNPPPPFTEQAKENIEKFKKQMLATFK